MYQSLPQPIEHGYFIDTPEGVQLPLVVAGLLPRGLALVIDWLVLWAIFWALGVVFAMSGANQGIVGFLFIAAFLVMWGYDIAFELLWGATPGKLALKLRVVHLNGTPVTWQASMIRNLLRVVDTLPVFYLLGGVMTLLNTKSQRLGDYLAGTLVVHHEKAFAGHTLQQALAGVEPAPLPVFNQYTLNAQERQTLLHFAERQAGLSAERRAELAQELAFLVPQSAQSSSDTAQRAQEVVACLLAYAQTIASGKGGT